MLIIHPQSINHGKDKKRKPAIFSIHVDPTGTRLATGGEDFSIRLWDAQQLQEGCNLLSTLRSHNGEFPIIIGAVLCVRWSNKNGKLLASSSDDKSIVVWSQTKSAYASNLSNDKNVESWKPLRTMTGHKSDVCHLEWSPDNTLIASAGFDNLILIWNTSNFEVVKRLSGHEGFVKGVCWDPLGQYLASQSDDKTLMVWRTADWICEQTIAKPFKHAPCNTYFRRLSWSPDGSNIISVNAEDGNMPACTVISRNGWNCEINMHGHQDPIEVCAFNPRLFKRTDETPELICALGSQDCGISVWSTKEPRAILSIANVFEQGIMDLSWSFDGYTLFASSFDGTVKALKFDQQDFGPVFSEEEAVLYFTKSGIGKRKVSLFEDLESLQLASKENSFTTTVADVIDAPTVALQVPAPTVAQTAVPLPTLQVQKTVQTKDGRKRVTPVFVSALGNEENTAPVVATVKSTGPAIEYVLPTVVLKSRDFEPLSIPKTKVTSLFKENISGIKLKLDIKNDSTSCLVQLYENEELMWEERMESITSARLETFVALATTAGTLELFSLYGRRLCCPIVLDSPASLLFSDSERVLVITSLGTLCVWSIKPFKNLASNISVLPVLKGKNIFIDSCYLSDGASPIVNTSDGKSFIYDLEYGTWMVLKQVKRSREAPRLLQLSHKLSSSEIEGNLLSALARQNSVDYLNAFESFIKCLSDEGSERKLAEICQELDSRYDDKVLGIPKCKLLEQLLHIIAENPSLQRLAKIYNTIN